MSIPISFKRMSLEYLFLRLQQTIYTLKLRNINLATTKMHMILTSFVLLTWMRDKRELV